MLYSKKGKKVRLTQDYLGMIKSETLYMIVKMSSFNKVTFWYSCDVVIVSAFSDIYNF